MKKKVKKRERNRKLLVAGLVVLVCLLVGLCFCFWGKGRKTEDSTKKQTQAVTEIISTEVVTEEATEEATEEVTEAVTEEVASETDFYSSYVPPLVWEKRADSGTGFVVCIDPGHQSYGDSTPEPNGPGSSTTKARVTGGTHGTTTGVYEYQLNLAIGLKLKAELESRGYTVYMTRESNEVNISNMERAQYATSVGADITVRIHANGCDSSSVSGAMALAPSSSNPYVAAVASESQKLSSDILAYYCSETGFANQGVSCSDTMTGINWTTMPVTILELGYMTNYNDDVMMEDEAVQTRMVTGIANGIDVYFSEW